MKDLDIMPMSRADMADEIMLLRAQVKVLHNWKALQESSREQGQDDYELARLRESVVTLYNEVESHKDDYKALLNTLNLRDDRIRYLEEELAWYQRKYTYSKSCG